MREYVIAVGTTITIGLVLLFGMTKCVDYANAAETTTLDEATNRPVKIMKYIDKKNNVICYWNKRHPADIECVHITSTRQILK